MDIAGTPVRALGCVLPAADDLDSSDWGTLALGTYNNSTAVPAVSAGSSTWRQDLLLTLLLTPDARGFGRGLFSSNELQFLPRSVMIRKLNICHPSSFLFFLAMGPGAHLPSTPAIEARADAMLKQLSLEEKIDLIGGFNDFYIREIKHIGLPALKMADGPFGVRNYGPSTTFGGIGLAATWDPELPQRMGAVIGQDARARGVHFMLGPGVNIYRARPCAGEILNISAKIHFSPRARPSPTSRACRARA